MRGTRDNFIRLAKRAGAILLGSLAGLGPLAAQERLPNEPLILKRGDWTVIGGEKEKSLAGVNFWTSFPLEMETIEKQTRARPGKETPSGIHFLRAFAGGTITPWQAVLVDDLPVLPRKTRDNDSLAKAFDVRDGVIARGTIQSGRSEFYRLKLEKDQSITMEVMAQRLLSNLDSFLRLLDELGRQLAFSDDEPGLGKDSRLRYTARTVQTLFIEVRDSLHQGNDQSFYVLRVGDIPRLTYAFSEEGKNPRWIGPDAANVKESEEWQSVAKYFSARTAAGAPAALLTAPLRPGEIKSEAEPNDQRADATRLNVPETLHGRFEKAADADWFSWEARKGEKYFVRARTRSLGLPTDVRLSAYTADGKSLVTSKVAAEDEGLVDFAAPADGKVFLRVTHIAGLSGPEQGYRLSIRPAAVAPIVKAETDKVALPAGVTADLKLTVDRLGHEGPIDFELDPKPEGLTLSKATLEAKKKEGSLRIAAGPDLRPGSVFQIRVKAVNPTVGDVQTYGMLTNQWGPSSTMAAILDGWITVAIGDKPAGKTNEK